MKKYTNAITQRNLLKRLFIIGLICVVFWLALTTFKGSQVQEIKILKTIEREVLQNEYLSNSKFVVTKTSTSYEVNLHPKCFVRNCQNSNNHWAFISCSDSDKIENDPSLDKATEWNSIGVRTMEKYIQSSYNELEGFSNLLLNDALNQFTNASYSCNNKCWSAMLNLAIVETKLNDYNMAEKNYENALLLSPTNEQKALVHLFWGLNQELSKKPHSEHYDKLRQLDPSLEKDYWGIATSSQGSNKLNNYGQSQSHLLNFALYKYFSPTSIAKYCLLNPNTQDFFIENRYIVLKHVLPPFVLNSLQKCYSELIASNTLKFGDGQSDRYSAYNDRCGRFIHYQLADLVRNIIAHNAIPSYTYFGGYKTGSKLDPHTDRQACEFTMSLNIQQYPHDKPWPLCAGKNALFEKDPNFNGKNPLEIPPESETVNANLYSGDALLFMGRHLVHFRRGALPEGSWTNQIFLHYVQEDFTGELA